MARYGNVWPEFRSAHRLLDKKSNYFLKYIAIKKGGAEFAIKWIYLSLAHLLK